MKSNSKKPLVSIIMNCYNGEKYLKESIKSIINQTYKNWELIFWDNCSTDNSKKITKKFKDNRIYYFKSKQFVNLYEARNLALKKCKGKYISFLDTDDKWKPNKLYKQISFFKKNKNIKMLYSNYIVQKKNFNYVMHKNTQPFGFITQKILNFYGIGINTLIVYNKILKLYKFKKTFNIIGDFDFVIRASQKYKIGYIHSPLSYYRVHENNYSSKNFKLWINELENWLKKNRENFTKKNYSLKYLKILVIKLKVKLILKNLNLI